MENIGILIWLIDCYLLVFLERCFWKVCKLVFNNRYENFYYCVFINVKNIMWVRKFKDVLFCSLLFFLLYW